MINHIVTVNLDRQLPLAIVTAKQGDTGHTVQIFPETQFETYDLDTADAKIYIKKPDGTKIYNTALNNGDGSFIVALTDQALAVKGDAQAELQLTSTENPSEWISTPVFILRVLPSNIDDTAIESSDEFTALETALATLSTYNSINCLPLVNTPSAVGNLADAFDAQPNHRIAYFRCSPVTTDKAPGAQNAGVLSWRYYGSAAYGCQLSFSASGLYLRTCSAGTWGGWKNIDPTYTALTSGQSSVTVNGATYSQIGQAVTVHVWFTPTEDISGALTGVFSSAPRPLSKVVVPIYPNSSGTGVASAGYAYIVRGTNDIRFSGTNLTSGVGYCFTMSYLTY